jgi:hypothetical protein
MRRIRFLSGSTMLEANTIVDPIYGPSRLTFGILSPGATQRAPLGKKGSE